MKTDITIGAYKTEFLAAPMTFSFCYGEMKELAEAVLERDSQHIWEEWNDVTLCLQAWVSNYLPVDWMPIFPGLGLSSANKFAERILVWKQIFQHHQQVFDKKFLLRGSNYKKQHKLTFVLTQAGVAESEIDFKWVENLIGAFEKAP